MDNTNTDVFERMNDIIDDFKTAMLVTAGSGGLHSRPMSIACHDEATGMLYFATSELAGKTQELIEHPEVNVSLQSMTQFVSLSGHATVINDRELIHKLYSEAWRVWFPDGPDQDDIRLIQFDPSQGEYWDLSGWQGLKFLWKAGKAFAQKEVLDYDNPKLHAKVAM